MKLFIDSADLMELAGIKNAFYISGITTNPNLISKGMRKKNVSETEYLEYLGNLRRYSPGELFIQLTCSDKENMIVEAEKIKEEIKGPIVFKLPATATGLSAASTLSKAGETVAITAVYTASQSYLASAAGAKYIIPYYSRIDQHDKQGIDTIREIMNICGQEKLLVASIKTEATLYFLLMIGVKNFTLPFDLFEAMTECDLTEEAVEEFEESLQISWKKKK